MASIKTTYVIQSCPACGHELVRVQAGTTEIASPLVTCPGCKLTFRTSMNTEWYAYKHKWIVWCMPLIVSFAMLIAGFVVGEGVIGIMAAIFGLIIGICISLGYLPRIIRSKKRMKDPEYLKQLLEYEVLTQAEYEAFLAKTK